MSELPSVDEILKVKSIQKALQTAWDESFTDKKHCAEQGGFIYSGSCSVPRGNLMVNTTTIIRRPRCSENQTLDQTR